MATFNITSNVYRLARRSMKKLFSRKYLLYTNTAICVGMSCTADCLQQYLRIRRRELPHVNINRTRDIGMTGFLIGPFAHYWYIYLDKWLPGKTLKIVAKKIAADQLICSPIVICLFLGVTAYLEGKSARTLKEEIHDKGTTLLIADWVIWPPAQAINFFFLPTKFRILYDSTISFVLDWYFSYVKYDKAGAHSIFDSKNLSDSETEGIRPKNTYDDVVDRAVTGSHVPFINVELCSNSMRHERVEQIKSKLLTLLHLDNIAADMDDMEGTRRSSSDSSVSDLVKQISMHK